MSNTGTKSASNGLHHGHRERLRNRFIESNGKALSDHELLELVLFYSIPRVNTNETAHRLINEFGSLKGVFNADREKLRTIKGTGDSTAFLIALLFEIRKRIDIEKYDQSKFTADSLSVVGSFFVDYFKNKTFEEVAAMFLDNSLRLIDFCSVSTGSVNSSSIDIRALARRALLKEASAVIIAHNHPGGILETSSFDREITMRMDSALRTVGVDLIEHIIVNDYSYTPTMHMRMLNPKNSDEIKKYKHFYNS